MPACNEHQPWKYPGTDEFIGRKNKEANFPTSQIASKKANDAVYLIENISS